MPRIMAFDAGAKRVGVAVTDPLQIIAHALETIETPQIMAFVKKYVAAEAVECFVVGDPKNLDGGRSQGSPFADKLVNDLTALYPQIPVVRIDERFTSQIAMQSMIAGGMKKMQRRDKAEVDKVSAALILQTYLDKRALK